MLGNRDLEKERRREKALSAVWKEGRKETGVKEGNTGRTLERGKRES